jgi:hypothetical protein
MTRSAKVTDTEIADKFLRQRILAEAGLEEGDFSGALGVGAYVAALLIVLAGASYAYHIVQR